MKALVRPFDLEPDPMTRPDPAHVELAASPER